MAIVPGFGSQSLINAQMGIKPAQVTTIPGISNTTALTTAQQNFKDNSLKTTTTIKKQEKIKPVKKDLSLQEQFNKWFNTNKAGYGNLFKKITGKEAISYNIPGSPTYKEVNIDNEKKYLQNLYSTGNEGQKKFAKTQAAVYGVTLSEPSRNVSAENPAMAGIFAQPEYQPGIGVKPLVTPVDTTPGGVPVVPSTITTPGLGDSSELIKVQSNIKPVLDKVVSDTSKGEGKPSTDKVINDITDGEGFGSDKEKNDAIKVVEDKKQEIIQSDLSLEQKTDILKSFNDLQDAITKKAISALKASKEQALIGLGQAQAAITPQYESQRARAATTSMQQARNFAEYLAARGQSTSGLAAQAELTRGSGLTRQLGEISQQEQAAKDQLSANKAKIQSDFQLAVANAKSNAEIAKLNETYRQLIKEEDRAYEESIYQRNKKDAEERLANDRKYNEMIFNRNRALELGDIEAARAYEKEMIDYRAQVEIDVAAEKAALAPKQTTEVEYDYKTDPDFGIELQDLLTGDAEQIRQNYALLLANSAAYIDKFDYPGYNELKKQMESLKDENGFTIVTVK